MAELYNDNVNAYTLGAPPPAPWVVTTPAGTTCTVEPDPAAGAPQGRVIRLFDNSSGDRIFLERPIVESGLTRVAFDLKVRAAQTTCDLTLGWKGTTIYGDAVIFDSSGNIKVKTNNSGSPTYSTLQAYLANTWYSVRYIVDTALLGFRDVTVNGTNYGNFSQVFFAPPQIVRSAVFTGDVGTFYVDDARAAHGVNLAEGIVRSRVTGQVVAGARVLVLRQSDNTVIAAGTTISDGSFSISVPSPDLTPCKTIAFRNDVELGSGRPHVGVF